MVWVEIKILTILKVLVSVGHVVMIGVVSISMSRVDFFGDFVLRSFCARYFFQSKVQLKLEHKNSYKIAFILIFCKNKKVVKKVFAYDLNNNLATGAY